MINRDQLAQSAELVASGEFDSAASVEELPTTERDYRFDCIGETIVVDNEPMSIQSAWERFPEDRDYIVWFIQTYA